MIFTLDILFILEQGQFDHVRVSEEEQQMINDMKCLMEHFTKQGFSFDEKHGTNDIHAKDSAEFFERYFNSDPDTLQIVREGYEVPLTKMAGQRGGHEM